MVAFFIETLLLMAAAYFLGAGLACIIRRGLYQPVPQPIAGERRVDPLPQYLQRTTVAPSREERPAIVPVPTVPQPAPAPVARVSEPQDLQRIHGIDAATEASLNTLGIHRYEQIAAWMRTDVTRVGKALGLDGRISQQNWIEQAQILAKGAETAFARRRARGELVVALPAADEARPVTRIAPRPSTDGAAGVAADVAIATFAGAAAPAAPERGPRVSEHAAFANRPAQPAVAVPVRPTPPATHDNLQRIGGIDAAIEQALAASGVTRYSQIAHWAPADVARFDGLLGVSGRIARENWIEQAQILSRGGDTAFSREYERRHRAIDAPPAIRDAPMRRADLGSLRSVRSEAYHQPEPGPAAAQRFAAQNRVVRGPISTDLKRIRGIGVLIEKRLHAMGVTSYEQIANWTAEDIARASQTLDFKGRIERENWVEQARILASGGDTEFSKRVDRGEVETSRYRP